MEVLELLLSKLFSTEEKVFEDWFSGVIVCPDGTVVQDIYVGYESVFEYELSLGIVDG